MSSATRQAFWGRILEIGAMAAVVLLVAAGGAQALPVAPIYFDGAGGIGFDPGDVGGIPLVGVSDPDDIWLAAGDPSLGYDVSVSVTPGAVHAPEPGTPSFADPFIVDVHYTVENTGAAPWTSLMLIFVYPNLTAFPAIDATEFGLDANALMLVRHETDSSTSYFGAIALPDLAPGDSTNFTLAHVVAEDIPVIGGQRVVPSAALAAVQEFTPVQVPEPVSVALLAPVLAIFARRLRPRR